MSTINNIPSPTVADWVAAARPKTLWAGFSPILLGTAIAYHHGVAHLPSALVCLITALSLQIGSNFANDYFDFKKGADGKDRLGPVRATSAGIIAPRSMMTATIIVLIVAGACSAVMVYRGGIPILLIGCASIASAVLYTGGPFPLAYNGLGEVFAFAFFGPIAVGGTFYVQAPEASSTHLISAVLAGTIPGLFSVAILTVNNLRDQQSDAKSHKRTLIVRWGNQFGLMEYTLSVLLALMLPALFFLFSIAPPFVLISMGVTPMALRTIARVRRTTGAALNPLLGATARLLLIHSVLLSIGYVVGYIGAQVVL